MNHYPHHIGDFNNATRHLTRVERSLYRDMLELYYDTEQPLNSDPAKIARRVLAVTDDERNALQMVLEEFFVLQDDGWHNARCDEEIAKYQGQIEQASRAGKASAAKRYGKNLTTVERPFNQPEPEPEPEPEPKKDSGAAAVADATQPAKTISIKTLIAEGIDKQKASDWLVLRKAKRLPLTASAWDDTKAEGEKVGLTPADTVAHAVSSNWAGFKASWYAKDHGTAVHSGGMLAGAI